MTQLTIILSYFILTVMCLKPLLELNDSCIVARTNSNGICKFIENCPSIVREIREELAFPTLCGFVRSKEIICCPKIEELHESTLPTRVSDTSRCISIH